MRNLTHPDLRSAQSINISGITLPDHVAEMSEDALSWMTTPDGAPRTVPSLPNGHALVCQIDLATGDTETWVCNNVGTSRQLYARSLTDEVTAIRWYTGYVVGLAFPEAA